MMKISLRAAAVAVACVAFVPAFAEDEAPAAEAPAAAAEEGASAAQKQDAKPFYPLLRCKRVQGTVQILKPRTQNWVQAEEGRFYPLGSTVSVPAEGAEPGVGVFAFGEEAFVTLSNGTSFATAELPEIGAPARTLVLKTGRVSLNLPRSLKEGLFTVTAPYFKAVNLAGESQFDYAAMPDGDEAVVRCVTGTLALEGRHYAVARMRAADQVRIRTTGDDLFTSLRGESGDSKVTLDQGLVAVKDFETGETKDEAKKLEFVLSPLCAIKIFRAKSAVGGRTVVSTLTFDALGEMKNRRSFAEGLSSVNSGEEVVVPVAAAKEDAKAKKAEAEATETEEEKPAAKKDEEKEDASEEKEEKSEKKDEKKEDAEI